MIGRLWRGATAPADADAYSRFLADELLPSLAAIDGYQGAYVLRRESGDGVEFVTLTLFDSMDAVRAFAGSEPERPVIEPAAERLLMHVGERVDHLEVVVAP